MGGHSQTRIGSFHINVWGKKQTNKKRFISDFIKGIILNAPSDLISQLFIIISAKNHINHSRLWNQVGNDPLFYYSSLLIPYNKMNKTQVGDNSNHHITKVKQMHIM